MGICCEVPPREPYNLTVYVENGGYQGVGRNLVNLNVNLGVWEGEGVVKEV